MSTTERKRLTLTPEQRKTAEQAIEKAGFTRRALRKAPAARGGTAEEVELRDRLNRSKVAAEGPLTIGQVRKALGGEGALLVATIGSCYPRQAYKGPPGAAAANALITKSGEWRSMSPQARQDCVAGAIWAVGRNRLHADITAGKRSRGLLELPAEQLNELYWLRALTDRDIASRAITQLRDEMFPDRRRWPKDSEESTVPTTGVDAPSTTKLDQKSNILIRAAAKAAGDDLSPRDLANRYAPAAEHLHSVKAEEAQHEAVAEKMAMLRSDPVLAALLDYVDEGMTQGLTPGAANAEARRRIVKDLNTCQKTITRHLKDAKERLDRLSQPPA